MEILGETGCDWATRMCRATGARRGYVEARRLMLQQPEPGDYVVAAGGKLAGRALVENGSESRCRPAPKPELRL